MIAGVDEVGRGPLIGAVVAAAVILPNNFPKNILMDSKKLTEKKRTELDLLIRENAISIGIGRAEPEEIDAINIFQASLLAMKRALLNLNKTPDHIQVDGKYCPDLKDSRLNNISIEAIIKGDSKIPEISAASIIAKVLRDKEMIELDLKYPEYGFKNHKGYPTKKHLEAIEKYGIISGYRHSFGPVKKINNLNNNLNNNLIRA